MKEKKELSPRLKAAGEDICNHLQKWFTDNCTQGNNIRTAAEMAHVLTGAIFALVSGVFKEEADAQGARLAVLLMMHNGMEALLHQEWKANAETRTAKELSDLLLNEMGCPANVAAYLSTIMLTFKERNAVMNGGSKE